jgi:hypothetical protein
MRVAVTATATAAPAEKIAPPAGIITAYKDNYASNKNVLSTIVIFHLLQMLLSPKLNRST